MIFDSLWGTERRRRTLTANDKKYLFITAAKGKCEYCGKNLVAKGIKENIHHINPKASGGSDKEHNLIVLCPDCHSMAHNYQISKEQLSAKIQYRLPKKDSAANTFTSAVGSKRAAPKKTVAKRATAQKAKPKKTTAKKATTKKTTARKRP